jgi:hypothetical protein
VALRMARSTSSRRGRRRLLVVGRRSGTRVVEEFEQGRSIHLPGWKQRNSVFGDEAEMAGDLVRGELGASVCFKLRLGDSAPLPHDDHRANFFASDRVRQPDHNCVVDAKEFSEC